LSRIGDATRCASAASFTRAVVFTA
jgi:hypothetical protein